MKKTLLLTAAILLMATGAFAQSTATATANAEIMAALTVTQVTNLNFGVLVAGTAGGADTVAITADAAGTRSRTGDVTLVTGGTVGSASFTVSGTSGYSYSFLPAASVNIVSGANSMTVNLVNGANPTRTLGAGAETHYVGGTLNVADAQAVGSYTGTFTVSANYN